MARLIAAAVPLLGRLLLCAVFAYSGYQKLLSPGRAASSLAGRGLPLATTLAYLAGVFELAAGLLLALGLKARPAALATACYLVVVTWLFHWQPALRGDHGQLLHLLKNAGLAGGLLYVLAFGAGPASIDRR
jgi:putative oxidoreductase